MGNYSREASATLPTTAADLTTIYTAGEKVTVSTDDGNRVAQSASAEYAIHEFKVSTGGSKTADITWDGQSNISCSTSPVYLQTYNYNSTVWETLDFDALTAANTDFTLTGNIPDVTNYESSGEITCRTYQYAGNVNIPSDQIYMTGNYYTPYFNVNTSPPNVIDITNPGNGLTACDKTGVVDCTTALNGILVWISENGGGVVYIPDGIYTVATDYTVHVDVPTNGPGITVLGQSRAGAIIRRGVTAAQPQDTWMMASYNNQYSSALYARTVTGVSGTGPWIVTDTSAQTDLSGTVGLTVYNYTSWVDMDNGGPCTGVITSATANSFTVGSMTGGTRQDWQVGDAYHIAKDGNPVAFCNLTLDGNGNNQTWVNEQAGCLSTQANAYYPGRSNIFIDQINLLKAGGSDFGGDGIKVWVNTRLNAYDVFGSYCGRGVITVVSGWGDITVRKLWTDGTGNILHHEGADAMNTGYGGFSPTYPIGCKWGSIAYPNGGAQNKFRFYDVTFSGHNSDDLQTLNGSLSTMFFDNMVIPPGEPAGGYNGTVFYIYSDLTGSTIIQNSTLNCGSTTVATPDNDVYVSGGTFQWTNNTFKGYWNTTPSDSSLYSIVRIDQFTIANGQNTFTSCIFDADVATVVAQYTKVCGIRGGGGLNATPNLLIVDGGSFSGNLDYAVKDHYRPTLKNFTSNATDYLYYNPFLGYENANLVLALDNLTLNAGSFLYLDWNGGILTATVTITQTNLTIPEACCGMSINKANLALFTVTGRKTIVGENDPNTTYPNAFGDDIMGAGNGDYYQNSGNTHRWRCTTSGWDQMGTPHNSAWIPLY